jgi:hypothetical protein
MLAQLTRTQLLQRISKEEGGRVSLNKFIKAEAGSEDIYILFIRL